MTRFVHLNGPPGIGKSTLSARLVEQQPGALNLDADLVHQLVGGWRDEENRTWQVVWPLVTALATTHLRSGRDVVMPQFIGRVDRIVEFDRLARENGATFREVVLLDDRDAAVERFLERAARSDDPWVIHHHDLLHRRGAREALGSMYDDLLEVVHQWPATTVIRSERNDPAHTLAALRASLVD